MRKKHAPALLFLSLASGLCIIGLTQTGCGKTSSPPQAIEESFGATVVDPEAEYSPLQYADGTQTLNDRCPIHQGKLEAKVRPLFVNRKPVAFCGPMCLLTFMEGPEAYLDKMGVELTSGLDASRPAVLDMGHRSILNYEVFFFADADERAAFLKNPTKHCGLLTDPVAKKRFQPSKRSPTVVYRDRRYYFLNRENQATFIAKPSTYEQPLFGMTAAKTVAKEKEGV